MGLNSYPKESKNLKLYFFAIDTKEIDGYNNISNFTIYRGVAKFGIALGSGPRGLGFKSPHSDHNVGISMIP
jgi:hypothetical protein